MSPKIEAKPNSALRSSDFHFSAFAFGLLVFLFFSACSEEEQVPLFQLQVEEEILLKKLNARNQLEAKTDAILAACFPIAISAFDSTQTSQGMLQDKGEAFSQVKRTYFNAGGAYLVLQLSDYANDKDGIMALWENFKAKRDTSRGLKLEEIVLGSLASKQHFAWKTKPLRGEGANLYICFEQRYLLEMRSNVKRADRVMAEAWQELKGCSTSGPSLRLDY